MPFLSLLFLRPNSTLVCEGQGTCVCGKCECDRINPNQPPRYSGKFCDCNNYACNYVDGQLCGGGCTGSSLESYLNIIYIVRFFLHFQLDALYFRSWYLSVWQVFV